MNVNIKIFLSCAAGITLFLLGFYFFQVEKLTETGYSLELCRSKSESISQINLNLEEKAVESLALEKVEQQIKDRNFVKVSTVKYISVANIHLAQETR